MLKRVPLISFRLIFALAYARRGFAVLPLYEPEGDRCSCGDGLCSRAGKHPRVSGGVNAASSCPDVINAWWTQWPEANIGIATGERSGIWILDVDGPEGRQSLALLMDRHGALPVDACVTTGNGRHYYFKTGGTHVRSSVQRIGQGLDLRGEGGYVVAHGSLHASGRPYRLMDWTYRHRSLRLKLAPPWLLELATVNSSNKAGNKPANTNIVFNEAYAEAALKAELDHVRASREGKRNETLNSSAFKLGQLISEGLISESRVVSDLTSAAQSSGLDEAEITATLLSGLQAGFRSPRSKSLLTSSQETAIDKPLESSDLLAEELSALGETDADNARRLARRFNGKLLYSPGRGFLVYDGSRWRTDDQRQRYQFAETAARAIVNEAFYCSRESDKAGRVRFSNSSLSKGALDRMLEVAISHLMKEDRLLDANPLALNLANGTVNLRTGRLEPHTPADLITRRIDIQFDEQACCPNFLKFLEHTLASDDEVIRYVQKALGYTLTGLTTEQVFFFVFGPGRTGKSTLVNLIRELLGEYGLHTPTETLLAKQYDNAIPADLARLSGARMVTAIEANWNRQLDEARLKSITGGEPITARFLRRDFFEFTPEFKLWFVANEMPGVRGTADAFWARVRTIPFVVKISDDQKDLDLTAKLKHESSGILNWMLEGCLAWQKEGLQTPDVIKQATAGLMQKADHLTKFVSGELIRQEGNQLASSHLIDRYRAWCTKHGETALTDKALNAALKGLDMTYKRVRTGSVWLNCKLRLEG